MPKPRLEPAAAWVLATHDCSVPWPVPSLVWVACSCLRPVCGPVPMCCSGQRRPVPLTQTHTPFQAGGRSLVLWVPSREVLGVGAGLGLSHHHEPRGMWPGDTWGRRKHLGECGFVKAREASCPCGCLVPLTSDLWHLRVSRWIAPHLPGEPGPGLLPL